MNESPVEEVLNEFDASTEPTSESKIGSALNSVLKTKIGNKEQITKLEQADQFAFNVVPDYTHQQTSWGSYYGPMNAKYGKDGVVYEWPSLAKLDSDCIDHYIRRFNDLKNPVLKARYADIVWELSKYVGGNNPPINSAQCVIDSVCEAVVTEKYLRKSEDVKRLKRALDISISINDQTRIEKVRDCMIKLESKIAVDDKPGLWGFCFDSLLENKKVKLDPQQEQQIIKDLDDRLQRIYKEPDVQKLNPHAAKAAALRLQKYYRRENQLEQEKRVLTRYRDIFITKSRDAVPLVAFMWLKEVYDYIYQSGFHDLAKDLESDLRNLGKQVVDGMKPINVETQIPREKIDQYLEEITAGSIEEIFVRIVANFIPDKEKTEEDMMSGVDMSPLEALSSVTVFNLEGRPTAASGSMDDDFDDRIALKISQEMQLSGLFIRLAFEKMKKDGLLTTQTILSFLYKSPIFREDKRELLAIGIHALLNDDHAVAVHMIVPQIEAALRELLVLVGGQAYKSGRHGDLRLRILDQILRDSKIEQVFGQVIPYYLRLLLTDTRGWNLRNNPLHGLLGFEQFGPIMSDRLLHVLLLLGMVSLSSENGNGQA